MLFNRPFFHAVAAFGLMAGVASALGAEQVGRVLLAGGEAFAVRDGKEVRLAFNSPIEFKDVLRTGAASSLQIRFVDDSLVSIRENSEFAIEDYQFGSKPEEQKSFFRLVKGGFRAVTGLIGRTNHDNYRVRAENATIGIRGTDYAVRDCRGDCGAGVKNGLYGSVLGLSNGTNRVSLTNNAGESEFGINQHFYVANPNTRPEPLLVPPSFVAVKPQGKAATQQGNSAGGSGKEQASDSTGASAESRPSQTTSLVIVTPIITQPFQQTETLNTAGTSAVLPPANGFGIVFPKGFGSSSFSSFFDGNNSTATFGGQNQLQSFNIGGSVIGAIGGGTITDTGTFVASNGQAFTWGRWVGGTVTSGTQTFSGMPLLFVTGSGVKDNQGVFGGSATYTFQGGPHPIDASNNVGTVTSSVLSINFTQRVVSYSLGMTFSSVGTFGPATFTLSGSGSANSGNNSGEFLGTLSGSCSGTGCASSSASGFYDVGTAGTVGYEFAVVQGGLTVGTKGGSVVFENAHSVSSFTPGALPSNAFTGQVAYANTSGPFVPGSTTSIPSNSGQVSGNNLIGYGPSGGFSGFLNTGSNLDTGSATLVDGATMYWGRWAGSGISITDNNGSGFNPGTGVPWVIGPANTTMPTSGTFVYSFAGGPSPRDVNGNVGTWAGGALSVSFGTTTGSFSVSSPLQMAVNGVSYSLSSCTAGCTITNGNVTLGSGSVVTFTGACTGGACSTGSAATAGIGGLFVGPQAGGIALAGNTSSPAPTVSFAGAFKR
jgi:hypothetical protein